MNSFALMFVGCALAIAFHDSLCGQDVSDAYTRVHDQVAKGIEFTREDKQSLKFHSKPLLQYTNPERSRGQVGAVYLWTQADVPAVIGSVWSIRDDRNADLRRLAVELTALPDLAFFSAELPQIEGQQREFPTWKPVALVESSKLENSSVKSLTAISLRIASRQAARRFSVEILDNRTSVPTQLRLLPQPIYEYRNSKVAWGGIFAFVVATDPEAFLQLEARRDGKETQWYFHFGRMTGRRLKATVDSMPIWEVGRATLWSGEGSYYFGMNAAVISAGASNDAQCLPQPSHCDARNPR